MPRIIKFILTGLSNTGISFVAFSVSVHLLPATPIMAGVSQIISYASGILWSFILNNFWVFRESKKPRNTLIRFVTAQVCLMLLSAGSIAGATKTFPLPRELIWVVVMAAITVLNFITLQKWVFKPT